jgi:hypothetical protein
MYTTLLHQYQLVLSARGALLNYCETISKEHLARPVPSFNNDSMGSQMRHVANTYLGWLLNFLQPEQRPYFTGADHKDLPAIRAMFEQVNLVVNDFLQQYKFLLFFSLTIKLNSRLIWPAMAVFSCARRNRYGSTALTGPYGTYLATLYLELARLKLRLSLMPKSCEKVYMRIFMVYLFSFSRSASRRQLSSLCVPATMAILLNIIGTKIRASL